MYNNLVLISDNFSRITTSKLKLFCILKINITFITHQSCPSSITSSVTLTIHVIAGCSISTMSFTLLTTVDTVPSFWTFFNKYRFNNNVTLLIDRSVIWMIDLNLEFWKLNFIMNRIDWNACNVNQTIYIPCYFQIIVNQVW